MQLYMFAIGLWLVGQPPRLSRSHPGPETRWRERRMPEVPLDRALVSAGPNPALLHNHPPVLSNQNTPPAFGTQKVAQRPPRSPELTALPWTTTRRRAHSTTLYAPASAATLANTHPTH